MKRIRVEVMADDIEKGRTRDGHTCAIARAVEREGFPDAHIGRYVWYPRGYDPNSLGIVLSKRVTDFLNALDDDKPVKPATFILSAPD